MKIGLEGLFIFPAYLMARKNLCRKTFTTFKQEERYPIVQRAIGARWGRKTIQEPNIEEEALQSVELRPSTSAEDFVESPPLTPSIATTSEVDVLSAETVEFGGSFSATAAQMDILESTPSTSAVQMDIEETTPSPFTVNDRSQRIEQLENQLNDRDDKNLWEDAIAYDCEFEEQSQKSPERSNYILPALPNDCLPLSVPSASRLVDVKSKRRKLGPLSSELLRRIRAQKSMRTLSKFRAYLTEEKQTEDVPSAEFSDGKIIASAWGVDMIGSSKDTERFIFRTTTNK